MQRSIVGFAFAASVLAAPAFVAPAFAASPETDAFMANIRLDAAFLAASSRMASDHSDNSALKAFAEKEALDEDRVVGALDLRSAPDVAQSVPMTVASNDVVTGRSAAVATEVSTDRFEAPAGTGALMPAAMITLDHLAATKGEAFDSLYKATQINALRQMAAFYNAYAMTGDDAALRQLAKSELAATETSIAAIARF